MPAKALIRVDMRIAILRELTAQGKGNAETVAEMTELLKERSELIQKLTAQRADEAPESRAE